MTDIHEFLTPGLFPIELINKRRKHQKKTRVFFIKTSNILTGKASKNSWAKIIVGS